jgi:hypothetical protein
MLAEQVPTGRPETISDARLDANRANAQHSTGPKTEEGKAKSSMNAVKTGLTGRTVLLSTDDAIIYQHHLDRNFTEFSPATDKEKALVQTMLAEQAPTGRPETIADAEWRLLRIVPLEAGIYAIGRLELADQFAAFADSDNREALILSKIFMTYRRDLGNLALQERRLRNQRKTDIAELTQLQKDRAEKEKELAQKRHNEVQRALELHNKAIFLKLDLDLAGLGFDFSRDELCVYSKQNEDQKRLTDRDLDFDPWLATFRAARKEQKAA